MPMPQQNDEPAAVSVIDPFGRAAEEAPQHDSDYSLRPRVAVRNASYYSRHNQVRRIGHASGTIGFTKIPNELIEQAAEIGLSAFAVMVLLLRHRDGWETSAVDIARSLRWRTNRQRVREALAVLEKAGWLVIRDHFWADAAGEQLRRGFGLRQDYVVRADGRRFDDAEREEWSRPVLVPRKRTSGTGAGEPEPSC
jgi:hypothetical protein